MKTFRAKWDSHFKWHNVTLIVVWDGDKPQIEVGGKVLGEAEDFIDPRLSSVFCNRSDACRNYGFYYAAKYLDPTAIISFDDDLYPYPDTDPIADHLNVLYKRVPLSWMNTGHADSPFYRGFPYAVRAEGTVHLSHGTWGGVGDLDSVTQMTLTPTAIAEPEKYASYPFFVGPLPRGVLAPISGMSLAFTREAMPFVYYAKQGPTTPFNRFADIWMGVAVKREFDKRDWAIYTGASHVYHSRASNVYRNLELEAAGLDVNERWWSEGDSVHPFFADFARCRSLYAESMSKLLGY